MQADEFKKMLGIAIAKEQQIVELYRHGSYQDVHEKISDRFGDILAGNKRHLEILEDLVQKDVMEMDIHCLSEFAVTDTVSDVSISYELTYRDLLIIGMKLVNELFKIYNGLGQAPNDSELGRLFGIMAQEEIHHKTLLESEYDSIETREPYQ